MLGKNVLKEHLVDKLRGSRLGLIIFQLSFPLEVKKMNILVLTIQKQEVEEYAHEESEVALVSVILISCPDLKSKTLSLECEIKYLPVIHNCVSNLSNYRKKSSRIPQLLLFPNKSKNY